MFGGLTENLGNNNKRKFMKRSIWIALGLLLLAAGGFFWLAVNNAPPTAMNAPTNAVAPVTVAATNQIATTNVSVAATVAAAPANSVTATNTAPRTLRLSNTTKSLDELIKTPQAILLANAFLDTTKNLALSIPKQLQADAEPGAYIVQAKGVIDGQFRRVIAGAGGLIVSYIPNNAYLVQLSAAGAAVLAENQMVQAVLPYEPYYKVQSSLLGSAVDETPLKPGTALTVGLFAGDISATKKQLAGLRVKVIGQDVSPFGPVLRVLPPKDWTTLARLPIVQWIEPVHQRIAANDLSRPTVGLTDDSVTTTNFLDLSGQNVLVAVNDSGIDATHPDLTGRVLGLPADLTDTDGHGTHVAGIIAGDGAESLTVTNAQGSIMPGTNGQFRGMAPKARLYSLNYGHSDYVLQTNAALEGALISNNSWNYGDAGQYDLAAACYDAATRDAVPGSTGSQPVLFVFPAGNRGGGNDRGTGGSAETILSPGTAKNVITVGALELPRDITNIVTTVDAGITNQTAYWELATDSSSQVAAYSGRGNVGIGTEGDFGRFKPDVVAPGSFVVSTRSQQWDTNAYFNPTNVSATPYTGQIVNTNTLNFYGVSVPPNAVGVAIVITTNRFSTTFPADLPIYLRQSDYPTTTTYDYKTDKNSFYIPGDQGTAMAAYQNSGFYFAVGNSTNAPVNYDLTVYLYTTNDVGDLETVLQGMDDGLGTPPEYYRYETGTSMAAAEVSGVLALIQDYFTNKLQMTPSPALLKAMLINGSRPVGSYSLAFTNSINFQGWGLVNIANSLPFNSTNVSTKPDGTTPLPLFFKDQSSADALATGDSHTYVLTLNTNNSAQYVPLQATLVWTDPCGDPAAAIKLVNNLDLIITNLDTGEVYFGNDISPDVGYNLPWDTNTPPNLDTINNVENIILPPLLAGSYSITVVGRSVNVNAVTAHTNGVVQDYALVVTCGSGELTDTISSVAPMVSYANPTGDQLVTFIATTNSPLFDQFAGASSPLLGTNTLALGANTMWNSAGQVTIGQTNQWHFYVVTNTGPTADYTNAAFITFQSSTLSVPRMGVFAADAANATRPQADIDLYVSTDPSLTNLNPVVISNCLSGAAGSRSSLTQGGTEYAFYTNSAPGDVYYIGVKSEDHMAAEYAFLPVFTSTPFSLLDKNGNQIVNGLLLPVNIPDGNNAHPGVTNIFALAIYPMDIGKVTVTNLNEHQNFGDLVGSLTFGAKSVVLNTHDGLGNTYGTFPLVYDDSRNPMLGTRHSDGPGNLADYRGQSALGPWILSELDDSQTQTGRVSQLQLLIQPHRKLTEPGIVVTVPPLGWFVDYVEVPAGYTNLSFFATNLPPTIAPAPLQMYEKFGNEPTLTDYDLEADLTNCVLGSYPGGTFPGNSISVGPPLDKGLYFIGIYNPNPSQEAKVFLSATLGIGDVTQNTYTYTTNPITGNLPDDAVANSSLFVAATQLVSSVNVGIVVQSPRISDYTFTLVSPTGGRVLLMENRGGTDTNGAGSYVTSSSLNLYTMNSAPAGVALLSNPIQNPANSHYYYLLAQANWTDSESWADLLGGHLATVRNASEQGWIWNTFKSYGGVNRDLWIGLHDLAGDTTTVAADHMTNFFWVSGDTSNYRNWYPGEPNNGGGGVYGYEYFGFMDYFYGGLWNDGGDIPQMPGKTEPQNGLAEVYATAATNFSYLKFTDDTNLTQVPIKFAEPPFSLSEYLTNYSLCDFESSTNGNYRAPTNIVDAAGFWTVPTNLVTVSTVFTPIGKIYITVTNVVKLTNNQVSVVTDPSTSQSGSNYLALGMGTITRNIPVTPGGKYTLNYSYRGPGIVGWWRGEGNASDSSDPENNGNNGRLIGRFNFPDGEVGQAFQFQDAGTQFQFAGTNTYVQIPQSPTLDVGQGGGFTVEGWINPTNLARPQPLVEWLAHVPTNAAVTNLVIEAGPFLNRATGHYYYMLGATNWAVSEMWANELGGHLVTVDTANEQNWVYDNFANYNGMNHNLWIGLTNLNNSFVWSSGSAADNYTNWLSGQPVNCDGSHDFTFMLGGTNTESGLWVLADDNGFVCNSSATNKVYGVVEVNDIQTNGVQFWVSVTNSVVNPNVFVGGAGCLYANIVDTNFASHEIFSAPGLLQSNVYQHVALTYNTNSGLAALYLNGTNVASTNLGVFVPKTDGDVLLGRDMSRATNNYYGGKMDEISIYNRAISPAEDFAIYNVSANVTNGLTGKFDASTKSALGLAEAYISLGSTTNYLVGWNNQWQMNSFSFTATTNSIPLQIMGLQPGMLFDSFSLTKLPPDGLYYLPEQGLSSLTGVSAYGNWALQVWDNRLGQYVTNFTDLLSWQLTFVLESNAVVAATLPPETPVTSTVGPNQTVYYTVTVPTWAHYATNILVSSTYPVDLLFNQTNPPTESNPNDYTLLTGSTNGIGFPSLVANALPPELPLLPGKTYYLGVRNTNAHAATVVLEVDYDITPLTNGIPYSSVLSTNFSDEVRYFYFDVSSNIYEATFQLLDLSSNADLVISKGPPLPTLTNSDYGSFNVSNLDENIYVLTNSSPVPLNYGRWYVGVIKRDAGPLRYTVLAKELDMTNAPPKIIDLTNRVPVNFTSGPGAALTNFFRFSVTNMLAGGVTNLGLRFELYNLDGDADLTVQTNRLPLAPPFYQTSQNSGTRPELIFVYTNSVMTNLLGYWYLGVPNHESHLVHYTIVASIETNAYFPAFPGAAGSGGGAIGGRFGDVYHVTSLADSGPGTLREAVGAANRTVVFDVSGIINLTTPLLITNSYLTIAGQTAPCGGVSVAGDMTTVQSAHDVIIRNVRLRPDANSAEALQFSNVVNVIADHVSANWSANNLLSSVNSSNVTVQWSILADSLFVTNNPPPLGSGLRGGSGALSLHHNLYANNYSGNPALGDNLSLDFVNNVIYNWGLFSGMSPVSNSVTNQLNYACNYLIAGPDTATFGTNYAITNIAFWGGSTNSWIFQTNNFIDSDLNGILNGANTGWNMFTNRYTQFEHSFPLLPVPTDEAFLAYEKVLDFAGVNLGLRDLVDVDVVSKVRSQTGTLISTPPFSGLVSLWSGENNANDSFGSNNGFVTNGVIAYGAGEICKAFHFNGAGGYVQVPASTSLNVGLGSGFTLAGWIRPGNLSSQIPLLEWQFDGIDSGVHFWISAVAGSGPGCLYGNLMDTGNTSHLITSAGGILTSDYQYVALTYDKTTGMAFIYRNGVVVASSNLGIFTPKTTGNLLLGARTIAGGNLQFNYVGDLDEMSVFSRPLSQAEIQSIYNAGSGGKYGGTSNSRYLDTDQDGIPDFWEITFGTDRFVPSNNNDRNGDGYTDLEEYNNWLAAPHALTITNTPVGVDLKQVFGKTGNLTFSLTNAVNGSVYLTNVWDGVTNSGLFGYSFAVFNPTNQFNSGTNGFGYASFGVNVTNNDTMAYFGPVTVSVAVSAVPLLMNTNVPPAIITLTNTVPFTNANSAGSDFYKFTVTTNGAGDNPVAVLFEVLNPSGPVSLVARYGLPLPSLSSYDYISSPSTNLEQIGVSSNSVPVALTNGDWYLSVVNISSNSVTYTVKATAFYVALPPVFSFPTNTDVFTNLETTLFTTNCIATDLNNPPLPLTYALVNGPSNLTVSASGVINWTPSEAQGPSTKTVLVSVANALYSVTNSFTIVVTESNLPPILPNIPYQHVTVPDTLFVTNTAFDPDIPSNTLTYALLQAPAGAVIDSGTGLISWTPTVAQAGQSYVFTTKVTDYNPWAVNSQSLSATNNFNVVVLLPLPDGNTQTNNVLPGAIAWFSVKVPTNAIIATNTLFYSTNLPANVWFSTNIPPTIVNAGDVELLANASSGISVLSTTSAPAYFVPGNEYFLGVQNPNAQSIGFALGVDFVLRVSASIVYTNINGNYGFLLTWYARSNDVFRVQWTDSFPPTSWNTFTNIVTYDVGAFTSPKYTLFQFFDDGSQTGGFGVTRYYRIVNGSQPPPPAPAQTNQSASASSKLSGGTAMLNSRDAMILGYRIETPLIRYLNGTNAISILHQQASTIPAGRITTFVCCAGVPPLPSTANADWPITARPLAWELSCTNPIYAKRATNLSLVCMVCIPEFAPIGAAGY